MYSSSYTCMTTSDLHGIRSTLFYNSIVKKLLQHTVIISTVFQLGLVHLVFSKYFLTGIFFIRNER